jgi:hypothetical protein
MITPAFYFTMVGTLSAITIFSFVWLWFMLKRPEQWNWFVDRENAFWVRTGVVPAGVARRCQRFEKGWPQKLLVGATALLGALGLVLSGILHWLAGANLFTH